MIKGEKYGQFTHIYPNMDTKFLQPYNLPDATTFNNDAAIPSSFSKSPPANKLLQIYHTFFIKCLLRLTYTYHSKNSDGSSLFEYSGDKIE